VVFAIEKVTLTHLRTKLHISKKYWR